jgi:hypothetical protein
MTKKGQKGKQWSTLHRKLKIKQHESTKIGGELRCSGSVSSSCSTSEDAVLIYIHNCKNEKKIA